MKLGWGDDDDDEDDDEVIDLTKLESDDGDDAVTSGGDTGLWLDPLSEPPSN